MEVWTVIPKMAIALGVATVSMVSEIQFRGTVSSPTQVGAEYIVFETYQNNHVRGLVYIQNSDIGSCFEGVFNSQQTQIQQITYTYPVIVNNHDEGWETNVSDEALNLSTFSHSFNSSEINENVQAWFNECLEVISNPLE
ncbi:MULTISPECIES: hypothetical protein [Oscillatoriales]|jgi:hypothetical protein|uniref:Uncharacterized protein n=1 Tax=Limnospira platensis NIES-46 TaxID=1236695 RepID=A0A5M3T7B7_LIMPL|nr:hypothetical protein [Arthrospira platensis]AMW27313.1 hypothetical protein AP285_04255 [Arthrospira platensis YZ]KDR57746.1 hypothetical protein APPUASWS_009140 [Arthrospira platensis str. Paraca]MBD2668538.1 hypothetical protein [Arthrospira platensis FACHB-439]MDF2211145.1 hypothetical protein [Arthrospira platensis NCB002]MDT9181677.1 hypothetical protein [Limnospira sp. PMC 289.06]MDT9293689.1 hypothetical protein [Arthrospira platensis PCC 7345]MDT9309099.1 hypothetical protein [Lim